MAREQKIFKIFTTMILALLLLVITAGTIGAQTTPDGHIAGIVRNEDTKGGIPGVKIEVGFKTTTTDSLGTYNIDIAPGTYNYLATKPGYGDAAGDFKVNSGEFTDGDFTMRQE